MAMSWDDALEARAVAVKKQTGSVGYLVGAILRRLESALSEDAISPVFKDAAHALIDVFLLEEELMVETGYPEYEAHRRDHDAILSALMQARKQCRRRVECVTVAVPRCLTLIKRHAVEHDRPFNDFLDRQTTMVEVTPDLYARIRDSYRRDDEHAAASVLRQDYPAISADRALVVVERMLELRGP